MAKHTVVLLGAVVALLALLASPALAHNTNSTTNIYNTNININLSGAFKSVFAFGGSGTDNGNARLTGQLQNFVGGWKNIVEGHLAAGLGTGSSTGSDGGGEGASWTVPGSAGGASGLVSASTSEGGISGSASAGGDASGTVSGSASSGGGTPGNGLCNGGLVIDYLCDALGISPVPPYQNHTADFSDGANFALSGSTALPESFFNHKNILPLMLKNVPKRIDQQLQWFNNFIQKAKNGGGSGTKPDMANSLFWIGGVGAQDFARIHNVPNLSSSWLSKNNIEQVANLIQGLVKQGAKYMVIQGLPPVGCLPLHLLLSPITERDQNGCAAKVNKVVMNHNELLQRRLGQLQKKFPQCVFVYADFWKAYMKVLSGYHQFGFAEPFKACCGSRNGVFNFNLRHLCGSPKTFVCQDASKHMVWDGVHFTAAMHHAIAKMFIHGGCTHPSIEQLVEMKMGKIRR
ncbi:hypothetical protein SAY86_020393 [Trapa natans]|uniref:GDSL esterase/lipase n=1 Tax=Trapa natans TaxID=22666 RepID=A0AAN7LQI0_TRANT|nr:hypothetical protein SAY86_020393 [Trapa natans]